MTKKKSLIIIDSNALIHRAYHALPSLRTKKGELINALYGFFLVFLKIIKEFQPDYIVATFDTPQPTFRHKEFAPYKIQRPPTPKELFEQIPRVKEVLKEFGVPIFEKENFEADDIIGTISHLAPERQREGKKKAYFLHSPERSEGEEETKFLRSPERSEGRDEAKPQRAPKKQIAPEIETIIVSGDLDVLQLIDKNTKVYTCRKGLKDTILYDEKAVRERYGIRPGQLVDFKALRGDPSDNIPGVYGIGEKTALSLIKDFGSLENLYKEIEEKTDKSKEIKPKIQEKLLQYKDQAQLSKTLVDIKKDVPIDFNLEECSFKKYNRERIVQIFKDLEFNSLINRLP